MVDQHSVGLASELVFAAMTMPLLGLVGLALFFVVGRNILK